MEIKRTKSVLKRLATAIFQRVYAEEREFRRIWPVIDSIEGLLVSPIQEHWLFKVARSLPAHATIVEIGSYKGRSTCCLGFGCLGGNKHVYAIDTFKGNDELRQCKFIDQSGYFDEFCRNIEKCELSGYVTPICGWSAEVGKSWNRPIHLLFIDGSHHYEDVLTDFASFFPHVVPGGIVAAHDVVETWPGSFRAWHEHIKFQLRNVAYCSTLGYGIKPNSLAC
jgi:predicted O-methyltransferase YrrM